MLEKTRKEKYKATRAHYPHKPAREVLAALRERASWVKSYPPYSPYNPPSDGPAIRWIENTDKAGLRFVGYADEIVDLRHNGWITDPYGDTCMGALRGAVWQLPARHGFPQYVAGYVDPNNDGAARIDFDVIEGPYLGEQYGYGGATSGEIAEAARAADSMAEHVAEEEREYYAKDQAEQRAEELRAEAAELRADLCGIIRSQREKISELLQEAADVEENPWQLFS